MLQQSGTSFPASRDVSGFQARMPRGPMRRFSRSDPAAHRIGVPRADPKQSARRLHGRPRHGAARPRAWVFPGTPHALMGGSHSGSAVRVEKPRRQGIDRDVRDASTPTSASTPPGAAPSAPSSSRPPSHAIRGLPRGPRTGPAAGSEDTNGSLDRPRGGNRGLGRMPGPTGFRVDTTGRDAGGSGDRLRKLRRGLGGQVRLRAHQLAPTRMDHGMDQNIRTQERIDGIRPGGPEGDDAGRRNGSRSAPPTTNLTSGMPAAST